MISFPCFEIVKTSEYLVYLLRFKTISVRNKNIDKYVIIIGW